MLYPYYCQKCDEQRIVCKPLKQCSKVEQCIVCKTLMRRVYTAPALTNTRDGFQRENKKPFIHEGREITTWKEWEKAGYRNPLEVTKDSNIRAGTKEKIEKIRIEEGKKVTI